MDYLANKNDIFKFPACRICQCVISIDFYGIYTSLLCASMNK